MSCTAKCQTWVRTGCGHGLFLQIVLFKFIARLQLFNHLQGVLEAGVTFLLPPGLRTFGRIPSRPVSQTT